MTRVGQARLVKRQNLWAFLSGGDFLFSPFLFKKKRGLKNHNKSPDFISQGFISFFVMSFTVI
jgi:hypothetical protein